MTRSANSAAESFTSANTETKHTHILLLLFLHSSLEVSIVHCKCIRVTVSIYEPSLQKITSDLHLLQILYLRISVSNGRVRGTQYSSSKELMKFLKYSRIYN